MKRFILALVLGASGVYANASTVLLDSTTVNLSRSVGDDPDARWYADALDIAPGEAITSFTVTLVELDPVLGGTNSLELKSWWPDSSNLNFQRAIDFCFNPAACIAGNSNGSSGTISDPPEVRWQQFIHNYNTHWDFLMRLTNQETIDDALRQMSVGQEQNYVYAFSGSILVEAYGTPVPIPAAAWLFGSALGLLGWRMRRTSA